MFPHYTVERNIGLVPKIEGWASGPHSRASAGIAATGGAGAAYGVALSPVNFPAGSGKESEWRGPWRSTLLFF